MIRKCNKCGKFKDIKNFSIDQDKKGGYSNRCKTCSKLYRIENKERIKMYYIKNRDKMRTQNKIYCQKNRNKRNLYEKKRMQTDPRFKLACRMRQGVSRSLKKGKAGMAWLDMVDYTVEDLIKRLKKTLPKGYKWADFLNKNTLHIDHIIPVSAFNFADYKHEDFKRCWALSNLQLLPAKDNLSKGAKIENHFQPSLLI